MNYSKKLIFLLKGRENSLRKQFFSKVKGSFAYYYKLKIVRLEYQRENLNLMEQLKWNDCYFF